MLIFTFSVRNFWSLELINLQYKYLIKCTFIILVVISITLIYDFYSKNKRLKVLTHSSRLKVPINSSKSSFQLLLKVFFLVRNLWSLEVRHLQYRSISCTFIILVVIIITLFYYVYSKIARQVIVTYINLKYIFDYFWWFKISQYCGYCISFIQKYE